MATKESCKLYYWKNRKRLLAKSKLRYAENKDTISAAHKTPQARRCRKLARLKHKDKEAAYSREYYYRNKQRILAARKTPEFRKYWREYSRQWEANHPEHRRKRVLKRHRLTPDEYTQLVFKQKNKCGVCGRTPQELGIKYLCVDHNHKTGKIRGLLCRECNLLVGYLERVTPRARIKANKWCRK